MAASPATAILAKISTKQLYRDLIRAARHLGKINNNEAVLVNSVRESFKKNRDEFDSTRIQHHREAAIRALSNYYITEAQRLAIEEQKRGASFNLDDVVNNEETSR